MDSWKRAFLDKLQQAQSKCAQQFEDALDQSIGPVFEELSSFLRDNGFQVSTPLNERGRRSFKAELAENAYLLLIFRFVGVGAFELRSETFVPGSEPVLEKSVGRIADIDSDWAAQMFQAGLDQFVELLAGQESAKEAKELTAVSV